jgi:hypothetical protein
MFRLWWLLLLMLSPPTTALPNLQTQCNNYSNATTYSNGSCYVFHPNANYFAAKISCNDFPGYTGHLMHITSSADNIMASALITVSFYQIQIEHLQEKSKMCQFLVFSSWLRHPYSQPLL